MKVKELIAKLELLDPEMKVKYLSGWHFDGPKATGIRRVSIYTKDNEKIVTPYVRLAP